MLTTHIYATIAVVIVLLFVNLITNKWAPRAYLLTCLLSTVLLLCIARLDELSWNQLGLGPGTWKTGILWSLGVFGAVVLFYAVAVSIPFARKGFSDKRAAEHGWLSVLYQSMIKIPFGTALLEETAFRSVLLAVITDGWGWTWGVIGSSILFGLWHVLPSLDFQESNDAAKILGEGRSAQVKSVVLTVIGTALAGVGFCLLRGISESIFPPIVLHASLNAIGFALSWGFSRRLREL